MFFISAYLSLFAISVYHYGVFAAMPSPTLQRTK